MSYTLDRSKQALDTINKHHEIQSLLEKLKRREFPTVEREDIPMRDLYNPHAQEARLNLLEKSTEAKLDHLSGKKYFRMLIC